MTEEAQDIELPEDLPVLPPVQAVGGAITVGPNENLDYEGDVATIELLVQYPTEDGPTLGLLPIVAEPGVLDMLIDNITREEA